MPTGILFPPSLPPPLRDDNNTEFEKSTRRMDLEIGMARQRRTTRTEPRLESVGWVFSQAQFKTFDLWFQNTIRSGELEFDILLSDDLLGLTYYTASMLEGYEANIDYTKYEWHVTAKLRLKYAPFAIRPPGTDDLNARFDSTSSFGARLIVGVPWRASFDSTSVFTGRFRAPPFRAMFDADTELTGEISSGGKMSASFDADSELTGDLQVGP